MLNSVHPYCFINLLTELINQYKIYELFYYFLIAEIAQKEAQYTSLSTPAYLNHLSTHLHKKSKLYVPYRDSKLTWLLRDSLGGNSKTTVIVSELFDFGPI